MISPFSTLFINPKNYCRMKQYIKREFLTPEEKKLIVKVKLPIARLDRVRDIFLFSCFTGLTFDDVDKLQEYNIEILENGKRQMKIYTIE